MHLQKREKLRETLILHVESGEREPRQAIDPLATQTKSGGGPGRETPLWIVLVRTLCPDRLSGLELDLEVRRRDAHHLAASAHRVHLDAALAAVPAGAMGEAVQFERSPQFV